MALVESGLREHGWRRSMQSLREQFRPESEGMTEADAIDRWEHASWLGDQNAEALAQRTKAQAKVDADYAADFPEPEVDPAERYAKEVSALRAEVAALSSKRRRYRRHG
jgi:hypothetical protein